MTRDSGIVRRFALLFRMTVKLAPRRVDRQIGQDTAGKLNPLGRCVEYVETGINGFVGDSLETINPAAGLSKAFGLVWSTSAKSTVRTSLPVRESLFTTMF
jgi:hypothetical protein